MFETFYIFTWTALKNDFVIIAYCTPFKIIFHLDNLANTAIWKWYFALFFTFMDREGYKFWLFMFCIDPPFFSYNFLSVKDEPVS